ncbi:ABC transporter substrate-binding protein [Streptomyces sp. NPDC026665]|uniref:ABC transporter substrate-binding protein n=1 Tax=Streptomyces sp. NPDC026665 TaxID=3154798 RepID=UPI0033C86AE8
MHQILSRRAPRREMLVAAAATALSIALTSCSGPSAAPASGSDAKPVKGGTLSMVIPADEGCVDPQQNLGRTQLAIGRSVVDSLLFQMPGRDTFQPWLAKSWTVSPDGTKYVFTLRDGVTFSDGSAFTANTVKANFDNVMKLGAKARLASTYLAGYQGTTVTDKLTATVSFDKPNAAFLPSVSTTSLGMLSDASAALSQQQRCQKGVVGTGPYKMTKYEQNQGQTLVRRDGYRWAPAALHQGDGYLDKIDVKVVPENGVRTGSVVSGQSDVMMEVQKSDLKALEGAGVPIEVRANPGLPQQYFVNTKNPVLGDVAVRRALLIGINRKQLVDSTLTKYQKVATGALSSTTPGYIELSAGLGYDLSAAKALLDKAGWKLGKDGIRVKDGKRLKFSVLYGSQLYGFLVPLMELTQQQLKELGMELTLRPLPDADANAAWIKGDYDLRISGLTRSDPDALRTGLSGLSPQLDKLLTQQIATTDAKKRMAVVADAQRMVIDQALSIPINELSLPLARQSKVHGVTFTGDSLLLLAQLWKNA